MSRQQDFLAASKRLIYWLHGFVATARQKVAVDRLAIGLIIGTQSLRNSSQPRRESQ